VGDTVYVTGDAGDQLRIQAIDGTGKVRWRTTNGASWKNPWPGSRSACTFDAGRLYHMNAHGRLVCLDAETGRERWAVNVLERFGARNITWGRSESVIVDGANVFVTVAGPKALMAALDKETGETVWSSPALPEEKAAYASPILLTAGKTRLLVNAGSRHSFAVNADSGKLLWSHRHPVPENVLGAAPILAGDSVVITNSSRDHSAIYCLELGAEGASVTQRWSAGVKNGQGGMVFVDGRLYGGDGTRREGGLSLVNLQTGAVTNAVENVTFGSAAYADGRIYYLTQQGEAVLLKPTAGGAEIVGRFRLVSPRKNDAWTHPVVAGGRLFLRYGGTLYCYDVKKP
jgi:outer membrane protein assembly factor BamB